jgi:Methyltransferase domain
MTLSVHVRERVKAVLRPIEKAVLRPIGSPLRRRYDRLRIRIEALEQRVASAESRVDPAVENLTGTVHNLTRTWLRVQNEVSRLASSIPEASKVQVSPLIAKVQDVETHLQSVERQLQEDIGGRGRRVDDTLRFLLDRVEFVRRELMFEVRYGARNEAPSGSSRRGVEPRILSPEKVEAARVSGPLRLNIGCGHVPEDNYINIDMRELPNVDVVAEAGALPFEPGSVDEIYSAHLVEHFPQQELQRWLLPHWRNLLKPGGRIRAITPDGEAMLAGIAQGSYTFNDFREVLFGGQDYEGDFHYNLFTPNSLRRTVEDAGFTDIGIPMRGRRNGQCFEFELTARLPPTVSPR